MSYKQAKKAIFKTKKWKGYFDKYAQLQMIKEWAVHGHCEVYFYDESGFSLDSNIPRRWSPIGEPLKIPANRFSKRINVLGFLNTQTKDLFHTIMNPKIKTTKSNILISPLYDTSGNRFTPFASKLLSA